MIEKRTRYDAEMVDAAIMIPKTINVRELEQMKPLTFTGFKKEKENIEN